MPESSRAGTTIPALRLRNGTWESPTASHDRRYLAAVTLRSAEGPDMRTSTSARRLGVAALAVATVVAGIPALASLSASAAPTGDLTLTGPTSGSAGSCLTYTVTPTDAFGGPATDTGTVVIRLTETPSNDATQDADFCRPGNVTAPAISPHYVNTSGARRYYVAGATVTDAPTAAKTKTSIADTGTGADNPDVASPSTPADRANPSGQDTAVYVYDGRQGASSVITFGVTARVPGGVKIDVFRSADGDETQSNGDLSRSTTVTFTAGGLPGSTEAADAVTGLKITPTQSYSPQGGAAHTFSVLLTNGSGNGVSGVTPQIRATAGPNAPTNAAPNGTFTASCTMSGNDGVSTCTYAGQSRGSDTITVWVNQTRARTAQPTLGLDQNEPRDTATATTTAPVAAARFVDLTPATATVTQGGSQVFTATVTDANGVPVAGVGLAFSETGPGGIANGTVGTGGTSTLNATTDASGRASITIVTGSGEQGSDAITVGIRTPSGTSCQTTGGRCTDSSTLNVSAASPSPSPSPTKPTPACTTAVTSLPVETINATGLATVVVAAAKQSTVDLFAYSRPSTTFVPVRSGVVGSDGTVSFSVRPPTNTRLYAQQRGCTAGSSVVLNVRTTLSFSVVRTGVRSYTFTGDSLPARSGGLIVNLYRINADGSEALAGQARADSTNGQWTLIRRFSGSGRFGFVARTGQDLLNAPGKSNVRSLLVY
jgi:hypothetical protein